MTRDPMPRWLLALVCAGAALMLAPFVPWVVLGIWMGLYAQRVHLPLMKVLGGRRGLSATITVLLFVMLVVPIAAIVGSLVVDAITLVQNILSSGHGKTVLERLASGGGGGGTEVTHRALTSPEGIADLVAAQGGRAWALFKQVAGAAAHVVIGLLILITGLYGVLVEGRTWYAWFEQHAPFPSTTLKRMADAFVETGRGLAVGVVGAGLLQSIVATIAYLILGVPQALALGMLTLLFSVIPAIGTGIVWLPVSAGLYLTGREGAALALVIIGVAVIGTIDNVARPYLARRGQLQLPTYVVLLAMFGGIELIGGWGLILGPLLARLAKEAILIRSESNSQPVVPP